MLIEGADYFVRKVNIPTNNGALVALNEDGTYSVYINDRLDPKRQKRAMRHEYNHMANDDLYSDKPIEEVENL